MHERPRKPLWPWIIATVVALPVLYVLSSGPARMIGVRRYVVSASSPAAPTIAHLAPPGTPVEETDKWWRTLYAPLWHAADEPWGELLNWYWDLFPVRR